MCKKVFLLLLLTGIALMGFTQEENVDSLVIKEMTRQHIAGMSMAIVKDGKVLLIKGYGFADIKNNVPITENTVFKIGSLSKQFIATAIMKLTEQGKIKLTDHIDKYFKYAPEEWKNISIRNLLNHTSGLERESPIFDWMKRQPDSVLIKSIYDDKLHFQPGTRWEYSNMGYFILADIIRKVTGRSFEDYMNNLFIANGLPHTVTTSKSNGNTKAKGYNYDEANAENTEAKDFIALRPSGAFSSSLNDMIRWDTMLGVSKFLSRSDWREMWEDTVRERVYPDGSASWYGYGWFVGKYKGHKWVHHSGNTLGFTADYWRFTDDRISIIILTNGNEVHPERIAAKVAGTLNPDFNLNPPKEVNTDKYLGVFADSSGIQITITREGKEMFAQATGQSSFLLEYIGKDKFRFEDGGIELDFNNDKKVMILKQHRRDYIFTQVK